jgi:hypothetical protein
LTFPEAHDQIFEMFSAMFNEFVRPAKAQDLVLISIWHSAFSNPITLPLMKKSDLTVNMLITAFEGVTQSYKHPVKEDALTAQQFSASVKIINMPTGGGRRPQCDNWEEYCLNNTRNIQRIDAQFFDNKCLVRAILKGNSSLYFHIFRFYFMI